MALLLPLVAAMVMASAQGGPATEQPYASGTERRVLEVPSRDAWPVVQARLKELGLAVDKVDYKNQVLLTRWWRVLRGGWLPDPQLPAPYIAERIRFIVFVSPFVELAHIIVGSQIEATNMMHVPSGSALVYNVQSANRALMAEVEKAIVAAALPKFVQEEADACSRSPGPQGPITAPAKIPLSVFEVLYPGEDQEAGTSGTVILRYTIAPDGGVTQLRVVGPPVGEKLGAAAMAAASLLLYSPLRMGGCPMPTLITYTVRFRMH